jgi:hypothetical protein
MASVLTSATGSTPVIENSEPNFRRGSLTGCPSTVEAIGEGVTGFAIGDKVSTIPAFSMNQYSVYGEQAIVPAAATVKHPDNLSWGSRQRRSGCST